MELEKPWGAVVQFGGQTAIKLAQALTDMGVPILGTSADGVDAAEDRERFDEILNQCGIPRAAGRTVFTTEQALAAAHEVGYPVLVRPSYVLGGQGMEIAYNDRNITEFMRIINQVEQEHPILVDKYLMGREVEVDGVFDGEELLIPGIMEHIERAGVHSGDSISVYPPIHIEDRHKQTILKYTYDLSRALGVVGLVNIQFVIYDDQVLCHRGQSPLLPYHPLYLQGHRRAHHRPGHQGDAGAEAARPGLRHGHLPGGGLLRRQDAGVLLREAHRRGHRPGPGDEVHRRGAWAWPSPSPRRCSRPSRALV